MPRLIYTVSAFCFGNCTQKKARYSQYFCAFVVKCELSNLSFFTEPWHGAFESEDELITAVCDEDERPKIPADCPSTLKELIEQCWHLDPKQRYLDRFPLRSKLTS